MTDEYTKTLTLDMPGLDQHARPGDSIPTRFKLMHYYWGISASGQMQGTSRQVFVDPVSVSRFSDAATPILARLCQTGAKLPRVTLSVRSEKDGKTVFAMKYEFLDVRIVGVRPVGAEHGPDAKPSEDITFEYEKLKLNVTEGEQKGNAELTPQRP